MWHDANRLRDWIVEVCKRHNFDYMAGDGSDLIITPDTAAYMPLAITAYSPHTVAVYHWFKVNGDVVFDPEVVFYVHHLPGGTLEQANWYPVSFQQPGIFQVVMDIDSRGLPVPLTRNNGIRQFSIAGFCNRLWRDNLKSMGYADFPAQESI